MPFPDKGLPAWPGGGGQHANDSGLPKDRLNYTFLDEIERVGEVAFNGLEGDGIPAAGTTDITGGTGTLITVTGSGGPITGFGTSPYAGFKRWVIFTGAPTITDSVSLKIYPSGRRDIIAAAGDVALIVSRGGSNWEIHSYQRADGFPLLGTIQHKYDEVQTKFSVNNNPIPNDNTPPLSGEGGQIFTITMTPKYIDSYLEFMVSIHGTPYTLGRNVMIALFKDAEASGRAMATGRQDSYGQTGMYWREQVSSVVSQTWKVRTGISNASGGVDFWVNADVAGGQKGAGILGTNFSLKEIREPI